MSESFIGIDVSRDTLDVASTASAQAFQVPSNAHGIEALIEPLRIQGPTLVVLEATGDHEFDAAYSAQMAGLPVAVVNPRHARDFAKVMGMLAKTDRLDATMLAAFARMHENAPVVQLQSAVRFCRVAAGHSISPKLCSQTPNSGKFTKISQ